MGDMYPAFLLLLLACSAHVTFGKALFTSAECDLDMDPLCDSRVHLVKRSASAGDCSPGDDGWECIGNVCTCHDGKHKRRASGGDNTLPSARDIIDSTKDEIRKDFEKNPLLSGLVKRNAASDSCSYGCAVMMHNVCQKCMTAEERQILDQNMENLDENMEDLEKRFQNNPWLSSLVKRSASDSECSPGNSWECIGNNCKCYDGKSKRSTSAGDNVDSGDNSLPSAREIIDSTKDKIRKDFEKNPLLSGLVKRSASASECRAGCAPPTKEIWQTNIATGAGVCKCLRPEQYLP